MGHRVEDPIIIVGTFRSASTLVAELLGSREDCHYLWFELSEEISRATGVPFGAPGADDLLCPPLASDDADDGQADALRQLLHDRCERDGIEPGARLVIKNPHLWHRLGWVRALLPEARLVVTVRDLRPTVASLKVLWQRSLRQHAHMHHLPEDPERCWDYVAPEESSGFASDRIFPGGTSRCWRSSGSAPTADSQQRWMPVGWQRWYGTNGRSPTLIAPGIDCSAASDSIRWVCILRSPSNPSGRASGGTVWSPPSTARSNGSWTDTARSCGPSTRGSTVRWSGA